MTKKSTGTLFGITFQCALFCWNFSKCAGQTAKIPSSSELTRYESDGHRIAVEWYSARVKPQAQDREREKQQQQEHTMLKPLLIILHGSGGIEPSGGFFRDMAEKLSQRGSDVAIVHYMDRNNLKWASNSQMSANFQTWVHTIYDGISFAQKKPDVDPAKISLFGHSLGAQLALHEAASDPRVHAIIDMAGCFVLPTSSIKRMPKVLIWHGTADRVVPLAKEKAMVKVLERTHTKYKEEIFPGADHTFEKVDIQKLVESASEFLK